MKPSNALLVAFLVVIAGLIGFVTLVSVKGCQPPEPVDPAHVPVGKPVGKPPKPNVRDRRDPPSTGGTATPKALLIQGAVKDSKDQPVAGAHIAIFPPARPGQPTDAPNMEDIKKIISMINLAVEEYDHPRPLDSWSAPADSPEQPGDPEFASAESKDDGTFTISIPGRLGGGPFRLTGAKEGVGSASVQSVSAGANVQLVLGSATTVQGLVMTDVQSVPVPNARVVFDNGTRRFGATTDTAGHFALNGLTPGQYEVKVAAKGETPLFETRRVNANDTNPIQLRLPRGTMLRVTARVINPSDGPPPKGVQEPSGTPVPNAQVIAYSPEWGVYAPPGTTNREGVVEFSGLPGGEWVVNGMAAGVVSSGEVQFKIDPNQMVHEETVEFEPAVDTPVEVVDDDGRPVAGMEFYTQNADDKYDALLSVKIAATDAEGKMKFPFEWEGPRAVLFGFKQGFAVVRAAPLDNTDGELLRLVAHKAIRVHGMVKTAEGLAIPGALIDISIISADDDAGDDVDLQIRTGVDGRYDFPFLPRVDGITLSATAPDGISQEDVDLELLEGKTDYDQDLVIELDEPPAPPAPPAENPRKDKDPKDVDNSLDDLKK